MSDLQERIAETEKELRETPHHKATDHHIGRLRAKLAQLKDQQLEQVQKAKGGGGGGYGVRKSGDATVVLVGPPSVGKSSLLNALTDANSPVAAYDFTTLSVIPGMMNLKGAKVQLFDVPGIVEGAAVGKGRGREVLSVVRGADLVMVIVDVRTVGMVTTIKKELYQFGLRLGDRRPEMMVNKKASGGLKIIATTRLTHLSRETIREIAQQYRIVNAELVVKEDLTVDRLIDGLAPNRVFLPYLIVVNKAELGEVEDITGEEILAISVHRQLNIEELKELMWNKLGLMRVYLKKEPGGAPDFEEPLILPSGIAISGAVEAISTEMRDEVKSAQIWGKSAKYPGQRVSLKHELRDEDVLYLVK